MPIDNTANFTIAVLNTRLQKMSICYGGQISNASIRSFLANSFDLVDCNPAYSVVSDMKTINPDLKTIGYYDMMMDDSTHPEEWYVHDSYGSTSEHRIVSRRWGGYLMNPNPAVGWSDYYAARNVTMLQDYPGYDGIFADDATYSLEDDPYMSDGTTKWANPDGTLRELSEFQTGVVSNWTTWMLAHMQKAKDALPNNMIMPNPWKYTQFGEIAHCYFWELFIHSGAYTNGHYTSAPSYQWGCLAINRVHKIAKLGYPIATHSDCSSGTQAQRIEWLQFCYCCLALACTDVTKTYFSWMFYGQDFTNGYYAPIMDLELGQPLSDYPSGDTAIQNSSLQIHAHGNASDCNTGSYPYYCGGVFAREFENYWVVVNIAPSLSTNYDYTIPEGIINGASHFVAAKKSLLIEK